MRTFLAVFVVVTVLVTSFLQPYKMKESTMFTVEQMVKVIELFMHRDASNKATKPSVNINDPGSGGPKPFASRPPRPAPHGYKWIQLADGRWVLVDLPPGNYIAAPQPAGKKPNVPRGKAKE